MGKREIIGLMSEWEEKYNQPKEYPSFSVCESCGEEIHYNEIYYIVDDKDYCKKCVEVCREERTNEPT